MQPAAGGSGCAHVGAHGDIHAQVAGAGRSNAAQHKGERRLPFQEDGNDDSNDDDEDR